jgi:hypothetical protein
MLQDPFPYNLTSAENDEQRRWETAQLDKEAKQRKKDNFKISVANVFKPRNNKKKLKAADPLGDHIRSRKTWISEQQKRGRVFRKKSRTPLPMDRWHFKPPGVIIPPSVFYNGRYMDFT